MRQVGNANSVCSHNPQARQVRQSKLPKFLQSLVLYRHFDQEDLKTMKLSCLSLVVGATAAVSLLADGVSARLTALPPKSRAAIRKLKEKRELKRDFMNAMAAGDRKLKVKKPLTKAERYQRLAEKIVEGSKNVDQRKLANNYYNYQNYQNYNNGQNDEDANDANEDNDANDANEEGDYDEMEYATYDASDLGFEMSNYAFKYAGCAAIKSYDVDNANEYNEPMSMDTYVVFRLCPADSCNKYSMTGCGKDYGEYLVEMSTYLSAIMEYYDGKYDDYCEYCLGCDDYQISLATEEMEECYAEKNAEDWQTYYINNNGDMSGYNGGNYANDANGNNQYANNNNGNNNNNANNANNGNNQYAQYSNYNGNNGGANYNNYYGNRKLANNNNGYNNNYGNNNYNNYNNGNYNNNQYNNNQNNENNNNNNQDNGDVDFGYYNENGEWVEIDADARGYWGADGMFYEYDNQEDQEGQDGQDGEDEAYGGDECLQAYAEMTQCDSYACSDYMQYCTDWYGYAEDEQAEASAGFDLTEYLECSEYTNAYGQTYYIAPHCGSNHFTVSLGVFSDANCLNYIGRDVSLSTVLGYTVSQDEFMYFPKECISCDGTEDYVNGQMQYQKCSKYNQQNNQNNNNNQNNDAQQSHSYYYNQNGEKVQYDDCEEYSEQPNYSQQGTVIAMCMALYSVSAQCNQNIDGYAEGDDASCSFISNIIYGSYDENGEIILDDTFDYTDWKNAAQYRKLRLDATQIAGLAVSLLLVIGLTAAVLIMHRSLARKEAPWRPKRNNSMSGGVSVSRQNSGIVLGRSRSGPGAAPLI